MMSEWLPRALSKRIMSGSERAKLQNCDGAPPTQVDIIPSQIRPIMTSTKAANSTYFNTFLTRNPYRFVDSQHRFSYDLRNVFGFRNEELTRITSIAVSWPIQS